MSNSRFYRNCLLMMSVFALGVTCCPRPRTISPSSFEPVFGMKGISEVSYEMSTFRSSFGLSVGFDSDTSFTIRAEDVMVKSGKKRCKAKVYDGKYISSNPDSLIRFAKGRNALYITSKMGRRKSDTLRVYVSIPHEDKRWDILRFVPADGVGGAGLSGMMCYEQTIAGQDSRYRLSILRSFPMLSMVKYKVFIEPRKGAFRSMGDIERKNWVSNIHLVADSLRLDYDRQKYQVFADEKETDFFFFRTSLSYPGSFPVIDLTVKRKDGNIIDSIPHISILPCDAVTFNGRRVINDTILVEMGKKVNFTTKELRLWQMLQGTGSTSAAVRSM